MGYLNSFSCCKNALIALNILFIVVGMLLIGVAAVAREAAIVTNVPAMIGLIMCGVLLILLAVIGLVGAARHNQVFLFFYMVILFMLFISQFIISLVLLFINTHQQEEMISAGWNTVKEDYKFEAQEYFDCCTLNGPLTATNTSLLHCPKSCGAFPCDVSTNTTQLSSREKCCSPCMNQISLQLSMYIKHAAGIGLFFSLTEVGVGTLPPSPFIAYSVSGALGTIETTKTHASPRVHSSKPHFVGVYMAMRFRNLKDPRADPSAFL